MTLPYKFLTSLAVVLQLSACNNGDAPNTTPKTITSSSYDRVESLMADMTLDEKLAQVSCVWFGKADIYDEDGNFDPIKMKEKFPHGIGCYARPQDTIGMEGPSDEPRDVNDSTVVRRMSARTPADTVDLVNTIQKWMLEETRLGIPTLFHEEGLHGFQGRYATAFPQSIALAATFDTELAEDIYSVTAREIRARGVHHVLSPVVDVALDPRWGRIEETFGEDPFLVSRMGVAAVKGFQGDGFPIGDEKVLTTLKHMTGHGQPESGMNVGPAQISERVLREIFFPPFEAAINEGNAATVMASYNEIDGIPSHANDWLLNDVLRGEWGFDGAVVADYFAISELQVRHGIVNTVPEAGALALKSGVDMELPDGTAFPQLKAMIENGEYDIKYLDQAVRRILELKERGNLYETPYADPAYADSITGNNEARQLALKAAQRAPVLLKNDDKLLPLNIEDYKRIAVIGPNSDITVLGGYSDEPRQTISILDGIKEQVGDRAEIVHAKGVELTQNRSWWDDEVELESVDKNMARIYQAVATAKTADLIILAIGGDESTSREAWSETHMGDRNDITLIGQQKELIEALAETGVPIATVVISGRPLSLENVEDKLPSILYAWILGQETGTAVADILFGEVNPGGKMPVTVPRNVGQIPSFYNHKPTARRGYAFGDASPLYPFGFGLSYTTFDISEPILSTSIMGVEDATSVSVNVTNTGDVAGDEVVQLYIRDKVSSVTRPVKELKGFKRVSLAPGESKTVSLSIDKSALHFFNRSMERVVEAGEFEIMVGNSSDNVKSTTLTVE
ncbi:beta-glucosidase [Litorimonas taeanensis]|uniref:Beta-D-glucoside glucohydrolase n=1 Tax=Litorimonas taeanensis TaxID=568099 RepID=A0A420WJH9_9PROT|nr:glycoside hydrolase family 3 N-terminal domain-containing protein [Litorimonas taeanensis]RKQ71158.1 beta-glucosidase [Litorimonas taeanensis]